MSGRLQHHIPRSFQRGFVTFEGSEQTYVYRRDRQYKSNIKGVAAQRDFYSTPSADGRQTLDDEITQYEGRLSLLLQALRDANIEQAVAASTAAEVIAHLVPRANSVRRMFGSGARSFVTGMSEILADRDATIAMVGLTQATPNKAWNDHFSSALNRIPGVSQAVDALFAQASIPRTSLDRIAFILAKETFLDSTNPLSAQLQQALLAVLEKMDDVAIDGHKKMLHRGLIAEPRKTVLEELVWHIRPAPTEGAIMPDCIALGIEEEGGAFLPYVMTSTVFAVIMPLTSDKLLVGVKPGGTPFDLSTFNKTASECSDELFIASSPTHVSLSANIGIRWKRKMESTVREALDTLRPHASPSSAVQDTPTPFSPYELSFLGGPDKKDIDRIAKNVQYCVERYRQLFDLTRLDGITFSNDFEKTLNETDRGFDREVSPEGGYDAIAQGVAALLVIREGGVKVRLVLSKAYALSFIESPPTEKTQISLHFLAAGLSFVDSINIFEGAFPGFLMKTVPTTDHEAVLHCAMRQAIRSYYYAYDSSKSSVQDLVEDEFSRYLICALDSESKKILDAKEQHSIDNDFIRLFRAAHEAASSILTASARLIGHLDGVGQKNYPDHRSAVGQALASRQLFGWFSVFSHDLQNFWRRATLIQEDLFSLNIHVEYLLTKFGIFIYPGENERGTMITVFNRN